MEALRYWAFGICSAAIACGLAQMILPKSGMQRIFNITTSVFFLSCLLSPVVFSPVLPEISSQDEIRRQVEERAGALNSTMEEQTKEYASESIRLEAQRVLAEMGITARKIYINVHDDEQGGISISECEVELDDSLFPRHDEIRSALLQRLGVNVLIGYKKE